MSHASFVQQMVEKDKVHGQGEEAIKDVVCGSIAGIVGKYIEYPFDTVKVRLQSQPDHLPLQYTGPLDCFKQSLKNDGFFGIYRGISAPLVGAAVETSCLFFSVSALSCLLRELSLRVTVPSNSGCDARDHLPFIPNSCRQKSAAHGFACLRCRFRGDHFGFPHADRTCQMQDASALGNVDGTGSSTEHPQRHRLYIPTPRSNRLLARPDGDTNPRNGWVGSLVWRL